MGEKGEGSGGEKGREVGRKGEGTGNGVPSVHPLSIKNKKERKCQDSIQLVSHLTQNTL